jgi:hypothetical protein
MEGLDRIYQACQQLEALSNLVLAVDEEKLDDVSGHALYLLLDPIRRDLTKGLREAKYHTPVG